MRQLDVVVITSKLCNLRCTYCYELPLLSDRTTMTLDQLGAMFEHVAAFVEQRKAEVLLRFAWHGGEPLLIKPDFYWRAFERQQQAFAASGQVKLVNHVQTNLTMLDQERLELLSSGFDQVGVSLDLTSGLRVNVAGRDQEHRTLANLDTVLASGLRPGGITVLSRANSRDVRQIYEFYRNRGMDFRLLPVHDSMQNPNHSTTLSFSEVLRSLCQLCDLWLVDAPAIRVEPIQQMIDVIVGVPSGFIELTPYAPELWQSVIIVDTDGGVYSDGELLDQENVMGNLFRQDLGEILRGDVQRKRAALTTSYIKNGCHDCRHFGRYCNGAYLAEGYESMYEQLPDGLRRCAVARPLFDHVHRRLLEAGVLEESGVLSDSYSRAAGLTPF